MTVDERRRMPYRVRNPKSAAPQSGGIRITHSDDGEESPRSAIQPLFAAIGEEEFGAADGAERQRVDAPGGDARLDELLAVRELNVNERVPVVRGREQRVGVWKLRAERVDDFRADLVAAGARRRADGRAHFRRVGPELVAHPDRKSTRLNSSHANNSY